MDKEFVNNLNVAFKEMLEIQFGLFKLLISDFDDKMYILRVKLGIIPDFYQGLNVKKT